MPAGVNCRSYKCQKYPCTTSYFPQSPITATQSLTEIIRGISPNPPSSFRMIYGAGHTRFAGRKIDCISVAKPAPPFYLCGPSAIESRANYTTAPGNTTTGTTRIARLWARVRGNQNRDWDPKTLFARGMNGLDVPLENTQVIPRASTPS